MAIQNIKKAILVLFFALSFRLTFPLTLNASDALVPDPNSTIFTSPPSAFQTNCGTSDNGAISWCIQAVPISSIGDPALTPQPGIRRLFAVVGAPIEINYAVLALDKGAVVESGCGSLEIFVEGGPGVPVLSAPFTLAPFIDVFSVGPTLPPGVPAGVQVQRQVVISGTFVDLITTSCRLKGTGNVLIYTQGINLSPNSALEVTNPIHQ